jgi:hypothetical protein
MFTTVVHSILVLMKQSHEHLDSVFHILLVASFMIVLVYMIVRFVRYYSIL